MHCNMPTKRLPICAPGVFQVPLYCCPEHLGRCNDMQCRIIQRWWWAGNSRQRAWRQSRACLQDVHHE
jgi:hypothetical protein